MRMLRFTLTVLFVFIGLSEYITAGDWIEDFEKAKALAVDSGKDLFVDFTGSDWCGWCIRLKEEVFDKEAFRQEAPKYFVLVKLDYPRSIAQSQKIKEQNALMMQQYQITGYPTVLLMNEEGNPYARTGYRQGGPEAYLPHLMELRRRKPVFLEIMDRLSESTGFERAKGLDSLLEFQKTAGLPFDPNLYREIFDLDAENKAGLRKKYEGVVYLEEVDTRIESADRKGDTELLLSVINEGLGSAKLSADQKQELMVTKASVHYSMKKYDEAIRFLGQAIDLSPGTELARNIPSYIRQTEDAKVKESR